MAKNARGWSWRSQNSGGEFRAKNGIVDLIVYLAPATYSRVQLIQAETALVIAVQIETAVPT